MVAPSVGCTLLTPIAPHSLSSRPVGIHEDSKIQVTVPKSARSNAFVSFDGREPMVELPVGYVLEIEPCGLRLPLLTKHNYDHQWFQSLVTKLGWNARVDQKPYDENEMAPAPSAKRRVSSSDFEPTTGGGKTRM